MAKKSARAETVHVGFRFPLGLIQSVDAIADVEETSRTEAIRRAIALYCRTKGIKSPETRAIVRGRPATVGK
jgi:metal-responsive CopG/Arc/MetJ family transcriptional regulator